MERRNVIMAETYTINRKIELKIKVQLNVLYINMLYHIIGPSQLKILFSTRALPIFKTKFQLWSNSVEYFPKKKTYIRRNHYMWTIRCRSVIGGSTHYEFIIPNLEQFPGGTDIIKFGPMWTVQCKNISDIEGIQTRNLKQIRFKIAKKKHQKIS